MAVAASLANPTTFISSLPRGHHHQASVSVSTFSFLNSRKQFSFKSLISQSIQASTSPVTRHTSTVSATTSDSSSSGSATSFHGMCYVVGDNIDTDQIIPVKNLTLVPSKPDEYKKLGSYALIGLPTSYETRFVEPGEYQSKLIGDAGPVIEAGGIFAYARKAGMIPA